MAALLGAGLVVASMLPAWGAAEPDRVAAGQLFVLINTERSDAGLAPLVPSSGATEVAEAWSQFMSDLDDLAHNDAWFTSETRQRLGAGALGENVATNVDIADAHRRLMNSPGHRANILDPRFTHIGIGAVKGPTGAWWITEDFFQMKEAPAIEPTPAPAEPATPPPPAPAPPAPSAPAPAPVPSPPPADVPASEPSPPSAPEAVPVAMASTEEAAAPVTPEPRELPASDPEPAPLAAAPVDHPAARPVVPVAVALFLIAANVQRVRRINRARRLAA